jgi:hypothetical protein
MSEDRYREWDAAYVVGALSPSERREFERHLAGCDACREAVSELAGMPAVLSELSPDSAVALVPSEAADGGRPGGEKVVPIASLAAAAVRRRRRRRAWQVAAAVGLVAAGGLGGAALSELQGPVIASEVTAVTLAPVGGSDVSADLTLTPSTWGTKMEWSCSYPSHGGGGGPGRGDGVYELVLVDEDGTRTIAATWTGDGGVHASGLLASSAIDLEEITRVELGVEGVDLVLAAADLTDA